MLDDTVAAPSAKSAVTSDLEPGTEIAGYVIDAKIGEGGMGKVYGAHHPRIGKRVAIKVLARSYCDDASAVARFEQEARLVNEIRHPNIVDVFQFGELPDKRSFFVMEWLTGETLSDRIDDAPLSTDEAIEILDAVCDALEAAHEHGVVHRDLKSDNVFLATSRGKRTVKLLDFGIAKLSGPNDLATIGKTASGMIVGTPGYMSPEQARGQPVSPRTDVYQLGILAYKMLTGQLPFNAENPFDLIVEQIKTPAPSPKKLAPGTPDALARLIVRMMAKESDARPSVTEVRSVFSELREAQIKKSSPRRSTSVLLGLTLFLAGFVSLGVFFYLRERNKDTDTPVAPAALPSATGSNTVELTPQPPALAPAPEATPAPAPAPAPATAPNVEIEIEPPAVTTPAAVPTTPIKKKRSKPSADVDVAEEAAVPSNRPGAILFTLQVASTIEIDGTTVAHSSNGGRFEVAAGAHEIRVKGAGRQTVTRTVDVPAGGVAVISIEDDLNAKP